MRGPGNTVSHHSTPGISRQVVKRKHRDKVTFEQGGNGGTNSLRGSPTGAPFAVPRDRRAAGEGVPAQESGGDRVWEHWT